MSSFPLPDLPPYLTLLLTGLLSPSCPLHLALAHLVPLCEGALVKSRVVIVTARSQDVFERKLIGYDDGWLNGNSLTGQWAHLLASIEIFYAKTPAHLKLIVTSLRPLSVPNSQLPGSPSKAIMEVIPSLVILHDISIWFMSELHQQSQVLSDYLNLVTMALDLTHYLSLLQPVYGNKILMCYFLLKHRGSQEPTRLALVDGRLNELRLPIVDRTPKPPNQTRSVASSDDIQHMVESTRQTVEPLFPVISKYFDWVGEVEKPFPPSPSPEEGQDQDLDKPRLPTHRLNLRRSTHLLGMSSRTPEEYVFRWREVRAQQGEFNERDATTIIHLETEAT